MGQNPVDWYLCRSLWVFWQQKTRDVSVDYASLNPFDTPTHNKN